jgi:hypothetical protein
MGWLVPTRFGDHYRVRSWTCDCRKVYYELCAAGGLAFLRRVAQGDPPTVHESARMPHAQAREMWTALLTGRRS